MSDLHPNNIRVQNSLDALNIHCKVIVLPNSTRTAPEAAKAVQCELGQIVKSLIFMSRQSKQAIMVVASGINRVDISLVAHAIGEEIEKADADFVKLTTGFPIGGVPPVGLASKIVTFIDEDLFNYPTVWAAAGTPHAVFEVESKNLVRMTGGKVMKIKQLNP